MKIIPLRNRKRDVVAEVLVDDEDFVTASRWRWCTGGARGRYARRHGSIYLHRFLMSVTSRAFEVDHINGNPLDCRRQNMRVIPASAQTQNVSGHGRSQYRGVHWIKDRKQWRAAVSANGKTYFLGYFESETDAAKVAAECRARVLPYSREALQQLRKENHAARA